VTLADTEPHGDLSRVLNGYIADVAVMLGIPAMAWWCEIADHSEAHLSLAERAPGVPDRDVALLWDEDDGWSIAVEASSGKDLIVLPPRRAASCRNGWSPSRYRSR
jgi:uncharacterized protein DUF6292